MNDDLEEMKSILHDSVRFKRNREGELITRVDINGQNEYGETALYQAAYNGHYQSVKYLLDLGADPNIANKVNFSGHYLLFELYSLHILSLGRRDSHVLGCL